MILNIKITCILHVTKKRHKTHKKETKSKQKTVFSIINNNIKTNTTNIINIGDSESSKDLISCWYELYGKKMNVFNKSTENTHSDMMNLLTRLGIL